MTYLPKLYQIFTIIPQRADRTTSFVRPKRTNHNVKNKVVDICFLIGVL